MPADDDGTTDPAARARLEAVAYGASSSPEDAAAARVALAGLEARVESVPPVAGPDARADGGPAAGASVPVAVPSPAAQAAPSGPAASAPGVRTGTPRPSSTSVSAAVSRSRDVLRSTLQRLRDRRIALGAALLVTALAAFGVGVGVGSLGNQGQQAAAASASAAAAGSVTLGEYLAAPQTFADQLPGQIIAPVRLHSTRLVFTNRSLSADDSQTPWDVYAAIGNDDDTICLIASADGRTSSQSCFARQEALSGKVVLVAQSASGILAVRVSAGVVTGRVAPNP